MSMVRMEGAQRFAVRTALDSKLILRERIPPMSDGQHGCDRQPAALWQWGGLAVCLILITGTLIGCSYERSQPPVTATEANRPEDAVTIPADEQWVDTHVDVQAGDALTISAGGQIVPGSPQECLCSGEDHLIGPQGTYLYAEQIAGKPFPLPTGERGPAPGYCLIGRIGDGPPFYIGAERSWSAEEPGRLYLGINDYNVHDNTGEFHAQIEKTSVVRPVSVEQVVTSETNHGAPKKGCSVVVFYVDGLRPDVVREMAAMGHLPNIRKRFIENGTWMSRCFTAFPSDTITSNGTMWTGCFSDRHGLKGQVRFSRHELASESYLDKLGPNRSSRLLAPSGVDSIYHYTKSKALEWTVGEEASRQWLRTNETGIPPLYQHLRQEGSDWATGILPIMTEFPPPLWSRSMTRSMPYLQAQNAWQYVDDANAHYASQYLLSRRAPVTVIWLPETDSCSHKQSRGQFGSSRRTIAQADLLLGRIVEQLESRGELENTYLILVSDHGHHGGKEGHLNRFDIADEIFHRPRQITSGGRWLGGGLGLSVRQHRFVNRHPGDEDNQFVFVDGDSDGVCRIFLPKDGYTSGNWEAPNTPARLLKYPIAEHLPPVNLVQWILQTTAVDGNGRETLPVDMVLMKLDDQSILITTADRGAAVISRKQNDSQQWVYRYRVVDGILPAQDGSITYNEVEFPRRDPLGLLRVVPPRLLEYYHSERTWLWMTASSRYPDSVVTLTRHMLWQDNLKPREAEFAPDLVVTARDNWYFGQKSSPGTMHGYPLADSMRASFFVSGPNVRRGARVESPCRLADLTPTILNLAGFEVGRKKFDGTPVSDFLIAKETEELPQQPILWADVDLHSWSPVNYQPLPDYVDLPISINHPESGYDLNNVVYNAISLPEVNLFRLLDDVISPLSPKNDLITAAVFDVDGKVRHNRARWIADSSQVLDVPSLAIGDYSLTSTGNLNRMDKTIDWFQHRGEELDRYVAKQVGRERTPGNVTLHRRIDDGQFLFWEAYRLIQRLVVQFVDETLVNGLENQTDRAINSFRKVPAETTVEEPAQLVIPDVHHADELQVVDPLVPPAPAPVD